MGSVVFVTFLWALCGKDNQSACQARQVVHLFELLFHSNLKNIVAFPKGLPVKSSSLVLTAPFTIPLPKTSAPTQNESTNKMKSYQVSMKIAFSQSAIIILRMRAFFRWYFGRTLFLNCCMFEFNPLQLKSVINIEWKR